MIEVKRFTLADKDLAEKAFAIRQEVFVKEQNVEPSEEFDQYEASASHYILFFEGQAVATCRWRETEKGVKMERFAVDKNCRSQGLGNIILLAALNDIKKQHADKMVYLHAQIKAVKFYERNGFVAVGPMFSECFIDHYKMIFKGFDNQKNRLSHFTNAVAEFHKVFNLNFEENPYPNLKNELIDLRYHLMKEENEEYLEAAKANNLVEIADALGDKLYILCGTIISHGLQDKIQEVFDEIHRSNMSKLDENGQPIYREDGKVMKSQLYFKPNIAKILNS